MDGTLPTATRKGEASSRNLCDRPGFPRRVADQKRRDPAGAGADGLDPPRSQGAMASAVVPLQEALSADFVKMGELALRIVPGLDGATLGSVMILYGIEAAMCGGGASRAALAAHLRALAAAVEREDPVLPAVFGGERRG